MSISHLYRPLLVLLAALLAAAGGCSGPEESEVEAKRPKKSIFKQRTQEVGEFDSEAGKELSDSKIKATNPLLAGLEAYGPAAEKVTKLAITHHLNLYNALHGHYPKDHEEFMREIIKKHNLQLPKLPYGNTYEYDVANHKLVVVKGQAKKK